MASLAPFRFSWTQDRGHGKNPVPSSPCPQPHSIALVAAGRNVARNELGRQKQAKCRSCRNFLHRCGRGDWVTQVVGKSRSCFQRSVVLDELCAFEAEPIQEPVSTYAAPEFSRNVRTSQGTAVSL